MWRSKVSHEDTRVLYHALESYCTGTKYNELWQRKQEEDGKRGFQARVQPIAAPWHLILRAGGVGSSGFGAGTALAL